MAYVIFCISASEGVISRTIASSHDSYVHTIVLPSPSVHAQVPISSYNVFASAAKDSTLLLWDLRCAQSITRFNGHVNRREQIGCSFSPCLKFLAIGSEDRCARIYDIVAGREIAKLPPQKDVASCVAFNPLTPQLACGSFDGSVRFYSSLHNDTNIFNE